MTDVVRATLQGQGFDLYVQIQNAPKDAAQLITRVVEELARAMNDHFKTLPEEGRRQLTANTHVARHQELQGFDAVVRLLKDTALDELAEYLQREQARRKALT